MEQMFWWWIRWSKDRFLEREDKELYLRDEKIAEKLIWASFSFKQSRRPKNEIVRTITCLPFVKFQADCFLLFIYTPSWCCTAASAFVYWLLLISCDQIIMDDFNLKIMTMEWDWPWPVLSKCHAWCEMEKLSMTWLSMTQWTLSMTQLILSTTTRYTWLLHASYLYIQHILLMFSIKSQFLICLQQYHVHDCNPYSW